MLKSSSMALAEEPALEDMRRACRASAATTIFRTGNCAISPARDTDTTK